MQQYPCFCSSSNSAVDGLRFGRTFEYEVAWGCLCVCGCCFVRLFCSHSRLAFNSHGLLLCVCVCVCGVCGLVCVQYQHRKACQLRVPCVGCVCVRASESRRESSRERDRSTDTGTQKRKSNTEIQILGNTHAQEITHFHRFPRRHISRNNWRRRRRRRSSSRSSSSKHVMLV